MVLAGLAVVAFVQTRGAGDADSIVIGAEPATTSSALGDGDVAVSTEPETVDPFVYRVGILSDLTTDNFWAFYGRDASVWNAYVLGPTKPALYTLDPADGSVLVELATAIAAPTSIGDRWQTVVDLNDALRWSDGQPITADDVVFTFETVRRLGLGGSWSEAFPETVASIEAESPTRLRVEFAERPGLAVWPYGPGLAPIMPAHVWKPLVGDVTAEELYALPGEGDVGGGPLAIETIEPGRVVSVSNPGYPHKTPPDVVEYHIFEDELSAIDALSAGDIDSILSPNGLAPAHLRDIEGNPDIEVVRNPANSVRYLGFNLNRPPMSDDGFRSALALLLDRENLASEIASGGVAYSFVSESNHVLYDQVAAQANAEPFTRELADRLSEALDRLRAAGYAWIAEPTMSGDGGVVAGTGLTVGGVAPSPLTILTPGDAYDPTRPLYAERIAETLGWLGFDVRPVETDFDTVVDLAFTPADDGLLHYDMYLLGWSLGNPSLPGFYRPLFAPDGVMNNTGYASDQFSEQLTAYERSYTFEEARTALWAMEATLARDIPYLPLFVSQITEAYRSDRIAFELSHIPGGLQGRLGGIGDVRPVH